jgi:hypothetical protein
MTITFHNFKHSNHTKNGVISSQRIYFPFWNNVQLQAKNAYTYYRGAIIRGDTTYILFTLLL